MVFEIQVFLCFVIFCEKIQKFEMAIFGRTKKFSKLGQLLRRGILWIKNFIEIALSCTVFEIQAFLCFAFFEKNSKWLPFLVSEIFVETLKG